MQNTCRILITGITGFIGKNFVHHFKNNSNFEIFGLDIVDRNLTGVIKTYFWDEFTQISNIDIIIHLAGKSHDTKSTTEEKAYFDINVGFTQTIFKYFLISNAKKFIFFSSVKAVADNVSGEYLTEETIPNPKTPYGKSKLEAETYILNQALPAYKKVFILRPSMIHGPGNKGNLNLLYRLSQKGFPWPLGAFENRRSFTSVDNLIFIIKQLIEKDIKQGIYQIADDEALSTNELISLIASAQNRNPKIWNIPGKLINITAKLGDYLHLPLNSERLKKLTESYVVSNEKIKKALGIEKMPTSAVEGMKKTLSSF